MAPPCNRLPVSLSLSLFLSLSLSIFLCPLSLSAPCPINLLWLACSRLSQSIQRTRWLNYRHLVHLLSYLFVKCRSNREGCGGGGESRATGLVKRRDLFEGISIPGRARVERTLFAPVAQSSEESGEEEVLPDRIRESASPGKRIRKSRTK
jgi:hypothetical protein